MLLATRNLVLTASVAVGRPRENHVVSPNLPELETLPYALPATSPPFDSTHVQPGVDGYAHTSRAPKLLPEPTTSPDRLRTDTGTLTWGLGGLRPSRSMSSTRQVSGEPGTATQVWISSATDAQAAGIACSGEGRSLSRLLASRLRSRVKSRVSGVRRFCTNRVRGLLPSRSEARDAPATIMPGRGPPLIPSGSSCTARSEAQIFSWVVIDWSKVQACRSSSDQVLFPSACVDEPPGLVVVLLYQSVPSRGVAKALLKSEKPPSSFILLRTSKTVCLGIIPLPMHVSNPGLNQYRTVACQVMRRLNANIRPVSHAQLLRPSSWRCLAWSGSTG
ncbi:hypothetical protein LX32DRAFT_350447 [Colletotrichum zoysiae]|uniref:Uncharacterized protein n=1 Tax=Colletotrichum zoysiae TaxID=1216348 RepID=A0AAD9HIL8_9PEZI|nr:hypothetical protein LX32DRAFT_350447 [Colletotrichum zoysiae]